ncbi:hypothetical protein HYX07_05355 [Candidatus Woesearchaeota archaeon]|nr:hypothetical protein [Candidatus Woesearchaeota archaeon]
MDKDIAKLVRYINSNYKKGVKKKELIRLGFDNKLLNETKRLGFIEIWPLVETRPKGKVIDANEVKLTQEGFKFVSSLKKDSAQQNTSQKLWSNPWFKYFWIPLIVAILGGLVVIILSNNIFDSKLKIVSIDIIEKGKFPTLDIKIRNNGNHVAFIKYAEIEVLNMWELKPYIVADYEPASWNYDLILPDKKTPYKERIEISQSIPYKGVDRFNITLGFNSTSFEHRVYHIRFRLFYDEDDKLIESGEMLLFIQSSGELHGTYSPGGEFLKERQLHNNRVIVEIEQTKAIKSKSLIKIISEIKTSLQE